MAWVLTGTRSVAVKLVRHGASRLDDEVFVEHVVACLDGDAPAERHDVARQRHHLNTSYLALDPRTERLGVSPPLSYLGLVQAHGPAELYQACSDGMSGLGLAASFSECLSAVWVRMRPRLVAYPFVGGHSHTPDCQLDSVLRWAVHPNSPFLQVPTIWSARTSLVLGR